MSEFDYTLNIPFANDAPKNDQPIMQINTNSIAGIIEVDHIGFGLANGGYHTDIHMTEFSSTTINPSNASNNPPTAPLPINNIGQLYTCQIRSPPVSGGIIDEVLYYQSAFGRITQLTNNFAPIGFQSSATKNGYTALPGGLIIQWGIIDSPPLPSGVTTPLLFATANIDFPKNCFNVQMTLINDGSTNNEQVMSVRTGTVSKTGFSWNYTGGSAYRGFYWVAIGI